MDLETVDAADFGRSLRGIGLNLLTRDVPALVAFLEQLFGMQSHRVSADFAIMSLGAARLQIHADRTYHSNPLLSLLPEAAPRGAGLEIRLYDVDPDRAEARAKDLGHEVLQPATDKPHGVREAYILSPEGYVWVPSRPL